MSEVTLTREQIEAMKRHCEKNGSIEIGSEQALAIITLALERLDMEPRPIAEAQDDWRRVLAFHTPSETWIFVKYDSEMEWFVVDGAGTCVSEGEFSHFISSLPKPKGT